MTFWVFLVNFGCCCCFVLLLCCFVVCCCAHPKRPKPLAWETAGPSGPTCFFFDAEELKATVTKDYTSSRRASAARETRALPRTACPHPSGTTSHAHWAPPTIQRRQQHTLSRASASTCVPTQVQQNESPMLAPSVLWQARAARGNLPLITPAPAAWKSEAPDTWPPCPGGLAPTLHRPPRQLLVGLPP